MPKLLYWCALAMLGLSIRWMIEDARDDGFAEGAEAKREAWSDGYVRGAKSVENLTSKT